MKRWQYIGVSTAILAVAVVSIGCSALVGGNETAGQELFEVRKGNITVSVSGSGNIEASEDAKLSFGVSGRIEEIYVEVGDEVSRDDKLARLETDALELALIEAQATEKQAQVALNGAQAAENKARVAITQAQLARQTAEYELEQTQNDFNLTDINAARAAVEIAERDWEEVLWVLSKYDPGTPGWDGYQKDVFQAEARLNTARDILDAMLFGFDTEEVAIKKQQVEAAEQSLELAEQSLELAEHSSLQTEQSLQLAQRSLELVRKQLDKATITAPFDGVVANVIPEAGDTVNSATQVIYLVDPATMELVLKLDEMDVPGVMLNQEAIISVDALPSVNFEGRVTSVYPVPIVIGGVVLYKTEISFDVPNDSAIKVGMSATADIVVSKKENVILVPNQAIEKDGQGGAQVSIMANGQIQKKPVVIGLSDSLYTEIVSGLSEGETVIVK